jgi:dethiobiotin synthetase
MTKQQRSKTAGFKLSATGGKLPSPDDVEKTLHELSGAKHEPEDKRIPFTTAISPHQRALLEVAAAEQDIAMADVLHAALNYYFKSIYNPRDIALTDALERRYTRKAK